MMPILCRQSNKISLEVMEGWKERVRSSGVVGYWMTQWEIGQERSAALSGTRNGTEPASYLGNSNPDNDSIGTTGSVKTFMQLMASLHTDHPEATGSANCRHRTRKRPLTLHGGSNGTIILTTTFCCGGLGTLDRSYSTVRN